jgi:methylmalonyl-CoA/ethylmalonyl-CoA epimerase
MLTRIDHVGIACRDLESAVEKYCSVFGLTVVSREVIEEQGVREAMLLVATAEAGTGGEAGTGAGTGAQGSPGGVPGASYIQLLEPLSADTPVGKFLARRGEGIHHIGYAVDNVRSALAEVGGTGVRLIDERPRHGSLGASIAFLHPADLGGVLTELVEPKRPQDG